MAFELYGMLARSISPMTGEPVRPAYGGDDEAFLNKVVTPIYETIAKVFFFPACPPRSIKVLVIDNCCLNPHFFFVFKEAKRGKGGKSMHSQWRNYDDLNEYFWYYALLFICIPIRTECR